MENAAVKFEREDIEGLVGVGSYILDAARRFGIDLDPCVGEDTEHGCIVEILQGGDLLSPLTQKEKDAKLEKHERLACQARIEAAGEIVVMTRKSEEPKAEPQERSAEDTAEQYRKDFSELPLDKKIANLAQLEAIALGETFSFILNSPYLVFDKLMDVMADLGLDKERRERTATRPTEHTGKAKEKKVSESDKKDESPQTERE